MVKKLIIVTALTALLLSACSALGQDSPTATLAPTDTQAPAPSATQAVVTEPPVIPTDTIAPAPPAEATVTVPSPTADIPRPTNVAGCTNSASFVADVTIPDNTEVDGGTTFVKTWRISNTGTCIWGPDYTLTHYSDERMGAPASVPLGVTFPGQTLDISLSLTAPNSPGTHRANFVIKNPAGLIIKVNADSRLWLIIQVKNTATATLPPTATQNVAIQPTNTAVNTPVGAGFATVTCSFSIDQSKMMQIITAINAYRLQSGLPEYKVNVSLGKAAQAHANDMACNNLNAHTGSNSSTVASRVAASGYVAAFSSENVYFSNPPATGEEAVTWWKNDKTDPRHNLNLVSDTFIEIGVGYALFNGNGYYVVVFATP